MNTNKIKLNESQLKQIVSESVKRVLREEYDLQEALYQTICNLESDLRTVIKNTDKSSSQAFGDVDDKLNAIVNRLSHVDEGLANQASAIVNKLQDVMLELQDLRINLKTFGAEDGYWGHNFKTPNGTVGLSNYR